MLARACDVADRGAVEALVRDVVGELGGLDALVANAGVDGRWDRLQDLSTEAFRETLEVNLIGTFNTLTVAAPHLRERRGYAIAISSALGVRGVPRGGAYVASKHGVNGLLATFLAEEARHGVRATAICPVYVDTDMTVEARERIGQGEMLSAEDVAETVLWCLRLSPVAVVREVVLDRLGTVGGQLI